jgi:hypothetical protein
VNVLSHHTATTATPPPPSSTPNHCCEQLLVGWKWGAMIMAMGGCSCKPTVPTHAGFYTCMTCQYPYPNPPVLVQVSCRYRYGSMLSDPWVTCDVHYLYTLEWFEISLEQLAQKRYSNSLNMLSTCLPAKPHVKCILFSFSK